jgi:hypothetical protein
VIGTILEFLLSNSWIGGVLGAGGTLLSGLLGGWKRWALVGVAFLGVIAWGGIGEIQKANLRADLAAQAAEAATWKAAAAERERSLQAVGDANKRLTVAYDALRADAEAAVAAVTKDRDRQLEQAAKLKTARENIHASAPLCVGEPPAYRDAMQWLRDTRPDP